MRSAEISHSRLVEDDCGNTILLQEPASSIVVVAIRQYRIRLTIVMYTRTMRLYSRKGTDKAMAGWPKGMEE